MAWDACSLLLGGLLKNHFCNGLIMMKLSTHVSIGLHTAVLECAFFWTSDWPMYRAYMEVYNWFLAFNIQSYDINSYYMISQQLKNNSFVWIHLSSPSIYILYFDFIRVSFLTFDSPSLKQLSDNSIWTLLCFFTVTDTITELQIYFPICTPEIAQ